MILEWTQRARYKIGAILQKILRRAISLSVQ